MTEPASIRFNNPGAMWGGNAISKRWGATANIALHDGLNQGNTIAFFPSKIDGAAAQFDLWRSGYCRMTLDAAIRKWSGGNSSPAYIAFLKQHTGLDASTVITAALLASDTGWRLMKAQAQWEAGEQYPLTDAQWQQAQQMCFSGKVRHATAGAIVVAAGGAAKAAHDAGFPIGAVIAIALFGVFIAALVWFSWNKDRNPKPAPVVTTPPIAPPVPPPAAPPLAPSEAPPLAPPPPPPPAPQPEVRHEGRLIHTPQPPAPTASGAPTPQELTEKIKRGEM